MFGLAGKKTVAEFRPPKADKRLKAVFRSMSGDCAFYEDTARGSAVPQSVYVTPDKENALFIRGEVYNLEALHCKGGSCLAEALWQLYERNGDALFDSLNGAFVLAVWVGSRRELRVIRDQIGILQSFYGQHGTGLVFGADPAQVCKAMKTGTGLQPGALMQYLLYNYNPGVQTLYDGVTRLRPAHRLTWTPGGLSVRRYWDISFEPDRSRSADEWAEEIRLSLEKSVRIRISRGRTGAFLSGGLDSSSVVSMLDKLNTKQLRTFSFRCRGESFDESHYAKIVADTFGTTHQLVEYDAEDILKAESMTALMDEPFSDVGINVATYLLAGAASGNTDLLFTGDGGDELFGGHPVYMADKMSRYFQFMPPFIRGPLFAAGRSLPDSEQKKDWKVKLKRFSESYAFPGDLGTQRWRIYYNTNELAALLNPDIGQGSLDNIYAPMTGINRESPGPDLLGRSLHADYQTVVQFYLRRMEMLRAFGLSPRFPMLDPDMVSLCARIPSKYKIRGWGEVKYIEKKAVEPLLPREIVHRKDKLGHSIPLKNWIRDHEKARSFVLDLISETTLKKRNLFNPAFVQTMIREHGNRTRNHSHRLWALAVLELWMRAKNIH
ncbi:hypothetical protein JW948_02265 [bacterium]|nr:hypothetical protein [bacterium]